MYVIRRGKAFFKMNKMKCPGCGEEMSKIKVKNKSGFECYTCGAYTVSFNEVKNTKCKKN